MMVRVFSQVSKMIRAIRSLVTINKQFLTQLRGINLFRVLYIILLITQILLESDHGSYATIYLILIRRRFISIDFPALKLNIQLPPSIKCMGSAIRGMWLSYDHFSDYGSSFYLRKIVKKHTGNITIYI